MKLSSNINKPIDTINSINKYIGDQLFKSEVLTTNYLLDQEVLAYNHVTPDNLLNNRFLKSDIRSSKLLCKGSSDSPSYIYIKLLVEKGVTRIDLLDSSNELVAYLYDETKEDHYSYVDINSIDDSKAKEDAKTYYDKLYNTYLIDESAFDRVVTISSDSTSTSGVLIHTNHDNTNAHAEHQVLSYYDLSDYSYFNKQLINEIVKIRNLEVNSGFLITEDFSKLFLGCYFHNYGIE